MFHIGIRGNRVEDGIAGKVGVQLVLLSVSRHLRHQTLRREITLHRLVHDGFIHDLIVFLGNSIGEGNTHFLTVADAAHATQRTGFKDQLIADALVEAGSTADSQLVVVNGSLHGDLPSIGVQLSAHAQQRLIKAEGQCILCQHTAAEVVVHHRHRFLRHRLQEDRHRNRNSALCHTGNTVVSIDTQSQQIAGVCHHIVGTVITVYPRRIGDAGYALYHTLITQNIDFPVLNACAAAIAIHQRFHVGKISSNREYSLRHRRPGITKTLDFSIIESILQITFHIGNNFLHVGIQQYRTGSKLITRQLTGNIQFSLFGQEIRSCRFHLNVNHAIQIYQRRCIHSTLGAHT